MPFFVSSVVCPITSHCNALPPCFYFHALNEIWTIFDDFRESLFVSGAWRLTSVQVYCWMYTPNLPVQGLFLCLGTVSGTVVLSILSHRIYMIQPNNIWESSITISIRIFTIWSYPKFSNFPIVNLWWNGDIHVQPKSMLLVYLKQAPCVLSCSPNSSSSVISFFGFAKF